MAEALYRKYRPQVFEDVVGQEPIERTLKNAIAQDKVSHAYLFCGPRGTGKTTTARLLAKALLCQAGPTPDPDGTCEDCRLIADGVHPDVYELDAASRTGVENVREEIISRVQFAPTRGRNKVYIIDEVHMLSVAAFNALLKTLEEPPSHVIFVLCTTDPQKVPETIHSRCQRFDFRRIAPESMVSRLGAICIAEGVEFEGEALDLIAHRAEGGLRNALTSLEQIIAFENGKVTLSGAERLLGSIDSNDMAEIVSYVGKRDIANCFRWTAEYVETGADLAQFVRDMAEHVRNLYVLALVGDEAELDISETTRHELTSELQWFGPDRLARLMGVLGDLSSELKTSSNPRLAFEIALTRMVRPDSDLTLESLAERIEALEGGYSAVAHVMPGAPAVSAMPAQVSAAQPVASVPAEFGRERATSQEPRQSAQSAQSAPYRGGEATSAATAASQAVPHRESAAYTQPVPAQPTSAASPQVESASALTTASPMAADAGQLAVLANPASMQRIWQAALSAVKKQKQAYGVLFMNTKAHFDEAANLVRVVFPAEAAFAFNAVQKPEVQEALSEALAKALGSAVPFAFERAGQASQRSAQSEASESQQAFQRQVAAQPASQPARQQVSDQPPAQAANRAQQSQGTMGASSQGGQVPPISQTSQSYAERADDMPPYEEVPYEDAPYEPVPYEEFDASPSDEPATYRREAPMGAQQPAEAAPPSGVVGVPASEGPDAATSASPIEPNLTPDGAFAEDPSNVEALLQAGFGGGVVFSEIEE